MNQRQLNEFRLAFIKSELCNFFLTYALPVISTSGCQGTKQSRFCLGQLANELKKDKRGEHKIKPINRLFANSCSISPPQLNVPVEQ